MLTSVLLCAPSSDLELLWDFCNVFCPCNHCSVCTLTFALDLGLRNFSPTGWACTNLSANSFWCFDQDGATCKHFGSRLPARRIGPPAIRRCCDADARAQQKEGNAKGEIGNLALGKFDFLFPEYR